MSTGICAAMCYVFLFAASKTYLDMEDSLQIYGSFLIFTVINIVGFFLVYCVAPVTEGKSLVEIEVYFSGQTRS
jgi:SP family facilitated glucose transporter-like MFS transporter 8